MKKDFIAYEQFIEAMLPKIEGDDYEARSVRHTMQEYLDDVYPTKGLYDIIFSHPFAKAFWGNCKAKHEIQGDCWLDHLEEMVAYPIPRYYLNKFKKNPT